MIPNEVLLTFFGIAASLTFASISLCSGVIATQLRTSPTTRALLNKGVAVVFTGLAIRLAMSQR
jgi:threonine/homoserine/homoserine lactone efflux protein